MSSAQLLPLNRTTFEGAVIDAGAFRELDPSVIRTLYDVDRCPPQFLPYLAWALSVDFWELAADDDQRRELIRNAIQWHRKRGTPWAIKSALAAFGYPVLELIEQRDYLQEWLAAGGRVLDGSWLLDGSVTLSTPDTTTTGQLIRRFALNHWAEYAIRLDAAGGIWTREHQRKIRRVAESFAPERSHLVGLIAGLHLQFDASVLMDKPVVRLRVAFNCCSSFRPVNRLLLDGCWTLDGGEVPLLLDGWPLDGRPLNGRTLTGRALDNGHISLRPTVRVRLAMHAGGALEPPPVALGGVWRTLDGRWRLDEQTLQGWPLNEGLSLAGAQLDRLALKRLDGTWLLGGAIGGPGVRFGGLVRIRRNGITTQEPLMSTPQLVPVTHAYRGMLATAALNGGALSKAAWMAFSESDKPYSPEEDTALEGEFARVPVMGGTNGPSLVVTGQLTGVLAGSRTVRNVAVFTESGVLMGRRVLKPKELEADTTMEIEVTFTY